MITEGFAIELGRNRPLMEKLDKQVQSGVEPGCCRSASCSTPKCTYPFLPCRGWESLNSEDLVPCMEKPDNCNLELSQAAADRLLVQLQNALIRFFHAGDDMPWLLVSIWMLIAEANFLFVSRKEWLCMHPSFLALAETADIVTHGRQGWFDWFVIAEPNVFGPGSIGPNLNILLLVFLD